MWRRCRDDKGMLYSSSNAKGDSLPAKECRALRGGGDAWTIGVEEEGIER